jgi:hypothetical protein
MYVFFRLSYLQTLLWQKEDVKLYEKSAAMWLPDSPGKHTFVDVVGKGGSSGQRRRSVMIAKGGVLSLRSKIRADVLNTREPWSDKSTLNLSFIPARSEIPIISGAPTEVEDLANVGVVITPVRRFRVKIIRTELIAARLKLTHTLPATVKHVFPQQKLWSISISQGKTEFSTQILSGQIPHFLVLMLQTEEASNGTLKTFVYTILLYV